MKEYYRKAAEKYLSQIEKRLALTGLKIHSEVLMGKPADEIIGYAERNPPGFIVMTPHGFSGISRWEYGSIADKVLRGVSSPVFLVRPQ
ncbi:MAG: universal stress protein [Chloroflexota bacterium]